jgi:phenylpropionate dioxygenase-like ring-hydroxylating dioxygenase large terminal subunit
MTATQAAETRFLGDSSALDNTIPILDLISPENFEREREKIFRRAWLPVAHVRDFAEPGSYKVVEIPTFGTSLIVVRGSDGMVRSFHNICRHRGNKLVRAGEGCRASFTCGFHGWTFANTGELRGVPDEQQGASKNSIGG